MTPGASFTSPTSARSGGPAPGLALTRNSQWSAIDYESMPSIVLPWPEYDFAANVGLRRQLDNARGGRRNAHGNTFGGDFQVHVEGAVGEAALAKYLDVYWAGAMGDLSADDVGRLQVRTVSPAGKKRISLILHRDNPDDRAFVVVIGPWRLGDGSGMRYRFGGWIWGRDGKLEKYWADPTGKAPAFFVPLTALNPMDTLPSAR